MIGKREVALSQLWTCLVMGEVALSELCGHIHECVCRVHVCLACIVVGGSSHDLCVMCLCVSGHICVLCMLYA